MKKVLVLGAGKSASSLIDFLISNAEENDWQITVADLSQEVAQQKTNNHPSSKAIALDVSIKEERSNAVEDADLVVSLLPPFLHILAAKSCLRHKKDLVTASYISDEVRKLNNSAKKADIILLNECGFDPGIDHMSAMKIIDTIHAQGGKINIFKSYAGGLVAPESNDNPWDYKFTWNPMNVILAGQGTAQYKENGTPRFVPYNRLFRTLETINMPDGQCFEGYANRDSLSYIKPYGLEGIDTILRGTLRYEGFCEAWDSFIKLGWTDSHCEIHNNKEEHKVTYTSLLRAFTGAGDKEIKPHVAHFLRVEEDSDVMAKLEWLGLFDDVPVKLHHASIAEILKELLTEKWELKDHDHDMVIMNHQFSYELDGKEKHITSSLVVKGEDQIHTAMAKTVGYPLGIAVKLILQGKIQAKGVQIPTTAEFYEPILEELKSLGVVFTETES